MHAIQKELIVEQTYREHTADPADDPINLLDVRTRELGVHGGAMDLHHAQPTNQQHEDQ